MTTLEKEILNLKSLSLAALSSIIIYFTLEPREILTMVQPTVDRDPQVGNH